MKNFKENYYISFSDRFKKRKKRAKLMKFNHIEVLKKAVVSLKNNPLKFVLCMSLDLLFFIFMAIIYALYFTAILPHFASIVQSFEMIQNQEQIFKLANLNGIISSELKVIIFLLVSALFFSFVVFVLIQSQVWRVTFSMKKLKVKWSTHLSVFTVLSLVWFTLIGIIFYIWLRLSIYNFITKPFIDAATLKYVMLFLLFVVIYFATISFSVLGHIKDVFIKIYNLGIKNALTTILAFLIIGVLFFVDELIIYSSSFLNTAFSVASGIILLLVSLTFARVYLITFFEKRK